jgi:8-oxo-dGTP pyrophosphatase MutT (NUDIX family)
VPNVPSDPYANEAVATALAAATIVPLRDGPNGLETVLLRRDTGLAFAGGLWVWPGGRIEDLDGTTDGPDPLAALEAAARTAAAREAMEEASLALDPARFVWFAHFTPPMGVERRYATFFFATEANHIDEITPDGHEVHEHRWTTPAAALDDCRAGVIGLSPPTWIVLEWLGEHTTTASALKAFAAQPPLWCITRFASVDGGMVAMYEGDAGYDSDDPNLPGDRHRLWMMTDGWRYEHTVDGIAVTHTPTAHRT